MERLSFHAPEPVLAVDVPVPGAAEDSDPHAALDNLTAYLLAARDPEGETFVLHRLLLDVTRRGLAEAGAEKQPLTEALGWMDAAFTGRAQDVRTWPVLAPLAPHAEAVAGYADAAGIAEPTISVLGRLDMLFHAKALRSRAEVYSRRALAIALSSFPPHDPRIATRLNDLAQLLQDTNRLGEAEPLMRRALAIFLAFQRDTGHAHPYRDAAIGNYAALLAVMGKSEAEIAAALAALEREAGLDPG